MAAVSATQGAKKVVIAVLVSVGLLLTGCMPRFNPADGAPAPQQSGASGERSAGPTGFLNPKSAPFGAKGDGVADDSAALQAWLEAGGSRLADGTYRITEGLTLRGNDRRLYTENAKILADGANITALTVTGSNANIRVHIDGNKKAAYGVKVTSAGAVVEKGRYENFFSTTQSAWGIEAVTTGGISVRNNVIRNIVSVGDRTRGNGNGASRGIFLHATAAAAATSIIAGNRIDNITGEEGDGIHVIYYDGKSNPFNSGNVTIGDNQIRNVSRRFIKVQASNVTVKRNTLNYDLARQPANPGPAIDIIRSEYVNVIGNNINPNLLAARISVNGVATKPLRGIDLRDNILRQKRGQTAINIYVMWATSPKIRNNRMYGGGVGVLVRASTNAIVYGNIRYPGIP